MATIKTRLCKTTIGVLMMLILIACDNHKADCPVCFNKTSYGAEDIMLTNRLPISNDIEKPYGAGEVKREVVYCGFEGTELSDCIFSKIDEVDINQLLDMTSYSERNLYLFVCDKPVDFIHPDGYRQLIRASLETEKTSSIDILEGYREVYVMSSSNFDSSSNYFFIKDNHLVFTSQWIDGLLTRENQKFFTEFELATDGAGFVWKFVTINGKVVDVLLYIYGYDQYDYLYIPANKTLRKI